MNVEKRAKNINCQFREYKASTTRTMWLENPGNKRERQKSLYSSGKSTEIKLNYFFYS